MPALRNSNVLVMDNGGYQIKVGFSNQGTPKMIPNCITKAKSEKRRAFIGDQIDECRDLSSLYYMLPFQRGYLVNWDHQKKIWDYILYKNDFKVETSETDFLFTEPYCNFTSIQEGLNEIFFEEYQFQRVFRTHSGDLACYQNRIEYPNELCCLIVDSGYSFTHIIPYVNGKRVRESVRRIDVGGKVLTNHLKEIISYRQLHVLDETYVMNCVKEDSCFVSLDFLSDLKTTSRFSSSNNIKRNYILPDFTTENFRRGILKGSLESPVKPDQQFIVMNNERFTVPEILFHPSDVGLVQMGLSEAIVDSINSVSPEFQPWLFKNIVLIGGNCFFPNIRERLEREVRALTPEIYELNVRLPLDPIVYPWIGGSSFGNDPCFKDVSVSRQEYFEKGHKITHEKYYL